MNQDRTIWMDPRVFVVVAHRTQIRTWSVYTVVQLKIKDLQRISEEFHIFFFFDLTWLSDFKKYVEKNRIVYPGTVQVS